MEKTRNGLQKSVGEVFSAYCGWNGVDLDQQTDSASAALLEQVIDQLVETIPMAKANRKAASDMVCH